MIGHDKPRLGLRPAAIAAGLLGVLAVGGLGWSLGRASGERAAHAPGPAVVQPAVARPAAAATSPTPTLTPTPASTQVSRPALMKPVPSPVAEPVPAARPLLATPAEPPGDARAVEPPTPVKPARVNINTAPAAELELLPGIGPGLAQRIIEHRQRSGRFRTVAELDKVKGIGPRTIERLRPLVSVE